MKPSREINYLRIGTFVILGLTALIIAILLLGSGLLFKRSVYIETYFNDTIQGLSEGSPVKYRGFDIGRVKKISFVNLIYNDKKMEKTHNRYIYVEMTVNPDFLMGSTKKDITQTIQHDIKKGLRVKLALQGLTGNAYLEIDFLNPKTNPALPIYWTPKNYYIPSATSTLTRFSDNVQYILDELKQVDITKFFNDIDSLVLNTDEVIQKVDDMLARNNDKISNTLTNTENASQNLRSLSEDAKDFPSYMLFGNPPPRLDPGKL